MNYLLSRGMSDDPQPMFRCCCVTVRRPEGPYEDRCYRPPTQEDGLCDECRQICADQAGFITVPLLTPCRAEEVPF